VAWMYFGPLSSLIFARSLVHSALILSISMANNFVCIDKSYNESACVSVLSIIYLPIATSRCQKSGHSFSSDKSKKIRALVLYYSYVARRPDAETCHRLIWRI